MRCHISTVTTGPVAEVDLIRLGSSSGLLWRSDDVTLVGLGEPSRVQLGLSDATSRARAALASYDPGSRVDRPGAGVVGFTALPFDRAEDGVMLIPPVVIVQSGDERFVTTTGGITLDDVSMMIDSTIAAEPTTSPRRISLELERAAPDWRDGVVGRARDRIAEGELKKAVLARLIRLRADVDFPTGRIIRVLARRFEHAHVFAIDGFVGASPELLVSRLGRTVRAHPLAGTAARRDDAKADASQIAKLLSSSKDRTEHRITIDWLLAELLPFCSYVDAEPEPSVLTLANVHHLGTLVEGLLSEPAASVLDLVAAVHPTPAVGGDPQGDALSLIEELEGFDRGRYAGPAGWVDADGNGEFAVSVRTAQIDGPMATIAAGVGVVAQSDPDAELAETQAKFQAMLGAILNA